MQEAFKEKPMAAYRRDRNLANILVHGKLKRDMPRQRPACKADCRVCAVQVGPDSMCSERDVIYGLICTECGKVVYVGETGRQLKERVEEHLRDIRLNKDKAVATLFNSSTHSIHNVQVSVLEKVHGQSKALCLIRKNEWINRLNTKIHSGLNSKEVRQM